MSSHRAQYQRTNRLRNGIARISAIVIIVSLGLGLNEVYGELLKERASGRERTELLLQLDKDNQGLRRDNDELRGLIVKQNKLLKDIALDPKSVTRERVADVTNLPPRLFPPDPKPPKASPNENDGGTTTKPKPPVTVKPEPGPTPSPAPVPLVCVPLVNLCI
jgi:hypothetical protein